MRPSHLGQSITAVAALAYLDMLAHICQPLLGTALVRLALYRNPYVMTRDSTYKHRLNKALPRLGTVPNQARKRGRGNPFARFVSSGVGTKYKHKTGFKDLLLDPLRLWRLLISFCSVNIILTSNASPEITAG